MYVYFDNYYKKNYLNIFLGKYNIKKFKYYYIYYFKMKNKFIYILFLINILDYLFYYYNNEKREYDKWGDTIVFFENNPILNNLIYQPMNTISNLLYYILLNTYNETYFNNFQIISVDTMAFGSIFMHGSFTRYGAFIDILGMISFFISYILKDLNIFGKFNNQLIIKYSPFIIIFIRYLGRYSISNFDTVNYLKDLKFFKLLIGLKVTGEIRKYSQDNYFKVYNIIWIIISSYLFLYNNENKVNIFLENSINFITFKSIFDAPWFILIFYGNYINNIVIKKQKNTKYFLIGLILIIISFNFQEQEFTKVTAKNEKSLFQNHTLWHILSAISLYYIDKYLYSNIY